LLHINIFWFLHPHIVLTKLKSIVTYC
jgi:hypothetical protein